MRVQTSTVSELFRLPALSIQFDKETSADSYLQVPQIMDFACISCLYSMLQVLSAIWLVIKHRYPARLSEELSSHRGVSRLRHLLALRIDRNISANPLYPLFNLLWIDQYSDRMRGLPASMLRPDLSLGLEILLLCLDTLFSLALQSIQSYQPHTEKRQPSTPWLQAFHD